MELMKNYSDLLNEIECIKLQIRLTENEFEYWSGIKLSESTNDIPLHTKIHHKTKTQLKQIEKKRRALNRLHTRLEYHEQTKERLDAYMKQFKGIEYQVAYKRWVEYKTLQEIADELGYSHGHIKNISMKLSKNDHNVTDILKSV